jgi:hypothetical protein
MNLNTGLAGPAAAGVLNGPGGVPGQHASPIGQDRLVRKEVSLGLIREIVPPMSHIGLTLFPFLEVPTDDVIFQYAIGDADGLAPARAEDAESEMAQKDDTFAGEGRASVIDWAIKDHYSASDVSRYREWLTIMEGMRDSSTLILTAQSATEGWQQRMAKDTLRRRRKLDNRLEWLIMSALSTGVIAYNDGKIKFSVDYGRPSGQQLVLGTNTTVNGNASYPLGAVWSGTTSDPIKDITSIQQYCYDVYGVRITRAVTSRKVLNSILNSDRFAARTGLVASATPVPPVDPKYLIDGWGPIAAQTIVEQQTGLTFQEYDSVYRTRPVGSNTFTANRFLPENRIIFLPDEADVSEFDDTSIGFGKVLTSPHPAGNWTSSWYEWERDYGVDPWGYDVGTGIKAFPVFPHMDLSFALDVMA